MDYDVNRGPFFIILRSGFDPSVGIRTRACAEWDFPEKEAVRKSRYFQLPAL